MLEKQNFLLINLVDKDIQTIVSKNLQIKAE